jgi:fucose 4-O-acetylase-like acetyltransferase
LPSEHRDPRDSYDRGELGLFGLLAFGLSAVWVGFAQILAVRDVPGADDGVLRLVQVGLATAAAVAMFGMLLAARRRRLRARLGVVAVICFIAWVTLMLGLDKP